jgi:pimeloyl-ACP methyl ester carboxylesterase
MNYPNQSFVANSDYCLNYTFDPLHTYKLILGTTFRIDRTIIGNQTLLLVVSLYFGFLISNAGFDYIPTAYGQAMNSSFQSEASIIDNMPAQRAKVGDVDIAYKQLGNGSSDIPILLIAGGGMTMDMWNPILLKELSSNQIVIIFDNRGAGESTSGTDEFSINQFANDTAGLLDALKIGKADIFGYSLGSFIAQELALMKPDMVDRLVLYASSCGGKDAIPPSAEVIQAFAGSTNSSSEIQQEKRIVPLLFPPGWFKANPDYQNYMPIPEESVSLQVLEAQFEAIMNWDGTCTELSNITQPTLVIVGTYDSFTPAGNSLMIVDKIPASWLVQIKDAGHGLMNQYPDQFKVIVSTFLETVR